MSFVVLVLASIAFIESFLFLDLGKQAGDIMRAAREALAGLGDRRLDDAQKEAIARAAARRIFASTGLFLFWFVLITGIIGAALFGVAAWSPAVGSELLSELSSPLTLAVLTAIAIGYGCVRGTVLR